MINGLRIGTNMIAAYHALAVPLRPVSWLAAVADGADVEIILPVAIGNGRGSNERARLCAEAPRASSLSQLARTHARPTPSLLHEH